jgi:hypothetical protein
MTKMVAPQEERDTLNFDFRLVALVSIVATSPELLHEYIKDGAEKDVQGVPTAIHDPTKWVRLRRLGLPVRLLAEMLFLFERLEVQDSLRVIQRVFRTMVGMDLYCDLNCPDERWFGNCVTALSQIPQQLNPAGVEVNFHA